MEGEDGVANGDGPEGFGALVRSSYVTEKHKERHAIKRYKARESAKPSTAFMSSGSNVFRRVPSNQKREVDSAEYRQRPDGSHSC